MASAGYVNRLMEVAALADVVVYVASDERYNDEVPTQFLHLLIKAGKAVVVLTKVRETDSALADHFRATFSDDFPSYRRIGPAVPSSHSRRCHNPNAPTRPRGREVPRTASEPDSRAVRLGHGDSRPNGENAAKYFGTAAPDCSTWPAATSRSTTRGRLP